MKKSFFFFISLLLFTSLSAQVPGYLGKKITLEYRPGLRVALSSRSLSMWHRADIGYTIGRYTSVHLCVDYNHRERYFHTESTYVPILNRYADVYNTYIFQGRRVMLGAYVSQYYARSLGLSPLGLYYSIGVFRFLPTNSSFHSLLSDTTFNNVTTRGEISEIPEDYKEFEVAKMKGAWCLYVGVGNRWVFYDRYLINFGLNYNLFLGLENKGSSNTSDLEGTQKYMNEKIFNSYRFSPFLGLGVIL